VIKTRNAVGGEGGGAGSEMGWPHRYLMTRLSLQVFFLCRHVSSTAPPLILWWSNLEILVCPLHSRSHLSLRRRAALPSNSNGTRSVHNWENPKSSLYCELSMADRRKKLLVCRHVIHKGMTFFIPPISTHPTVQYKDQQKGKVSQYLCISIIQFIYR
jgi:hypothetical protein